MNLHEAVERVGSYERELMDALYTVDRAADAIDEASAEVVDRHGGRYNSIVTAADEAADGDIRYRMNWLYPGDGLMTEEGEDVEGERTWKADPIDGTTNFENGSNFWSISLSLEDGGEPLVGVVHSPGQALGKTYFAAAGEGAYLMEDGDIQQLAVNDRELPGSIVTTKQADFYPGEWERDARMNEALTKEKEANIRVYNSGALENCMVAEGVAAGFVSHIESPWDFGAAQLIVEEAGGEVSVENTHREKPEYSDNRQVVTSNGVVHETLLDLAEEHLQ